MNDHDWKVFLQTCRRILGAGSCDPFSSESWCAFTTFSSLSHGLNYINCGLPDLDDCLDTCTRDGGVWAQSIEYSDLAHLIIPKTFYWETSIARFENGYKTQDINVLSNELLKQSIEHRLTNLVLEIKLY